MKLRCSIDAVVAPPSSSVTLAEHDPHCANNRCSWRPPCCRGVWVPRPGRRQEKQNATEPAAPAEPRTLLRCGGANRPPEERQTRKPAPSAAAPRKTPSPKRAAPATRATARRASNPADLRRAGGDAPPRPPPPPTPPTTQQPAAAGAPPAPTPPPAPHPPTQPPPHPPQPGHTRRPPTPPTTHPTPRQTPPRLGSTALQSKKRPDLLRGTAQSALYPPPPRHFISLIITPRFASSSMYFSAGIASSGVNTPAFPISPRACI